MRTAVVARLSDNWIFVALSGALLALLVAILIANDGVFVYTLDDPYIHLQFSTQLWRGHFGLVPEEISSPSSSILWPLLLAPFSTSALHPFVPLVINVAALFATLALWRRALRNFVFERDDPASGLHADVLAIIVVVANNGLALVFTGMEHSLQVAATMAALVGAIELIETGRMRWWTLAGIIAGPLLRYENIPLSITVLAVLVASGAWRAALASGIALASGLAAFTVVSLSIGLPPIPGSVQIKTAFGLSLSSSLLRAWEALAHLAMKIFRAQVAFDGVFVMAVLALRGILSPNGLGLARWLLLLGVLGSMALQFAFGMHILSGRYDSYAFAAGLLCCAYFHRRPLQILAAHLRSAWRLAAVAAVLVPILIPSSFMPLLLVHLGSQDIYRQQWQMRRFLQTLGDEGVAANDVGLASYHGGQRILDLVGLGSEEMRRRLIAQTVTSETMKTLFEQRNINAVLIYKDWFSPSMLPKMEPIACFDLGRREVSSANRAVWLFALNEAAANRLRQKAIDFAPSMPRKTKLRVLPPGSEDLDQC